MLLKRLDFEVINLSNMANTLDELGKLVERDFLLVIILLDHRCKGAAVLRVWTECNLGQCW